ncbi:hypothetical protein A33M_0046 [Rhodovulum sp. PH10]|uniref:TIGR03809 family protein n=1 Tax=Rhodovulum sp. PH10 TaxID=1187851 RepID=UPI00027C25B3|nr:TIGR03809 family protein [Rhodovulum sp. PH10]EJW13716.1 hypothetical protein A33M_0046 [Rhodovulum sp. PH10]
MIDTIPRGVPAETAAKGLALAQRRLAHLVELYKSGRWQRYFPERDFLDRMRRAMHEVEAWTKAVAVWKPDERASAARRPVRPDADRTAHPAGAPITIVTSTDPAADPSAPDGEADAPDPDAAAFEAIASRLMELAAAGGRA